MIDLQPNPNRTFLPLFERSKWERVRFGEVVENLNETCELGAAGVERVIAMEHLEPGSLHVREWGEVAKGTTFTRRCRAGQVLFGKRRAYQRKVAVAEFDAVVSGDIYVLAPRNERLLPGLLPFLCLSERFFQFAIETSAGSLSPRTNWSSLASFEFDLPPLDQQRRIAEILWAVDECKVKGERLLSSLEAVRKATRDSACDDDVETKRFAQVITYASDGPFGSKLKTEHYANDGARVVRLQNVGDGVFDDSDQVFISKPYFDELKRYEVRAGDVIIAGLGDETHPVGRAALIPRSLGPAVNKADCFCVRANPAVVSNAYLVTFLNSRNGCAQVAARAQGTTRMRINVGNLKTVIVPVPSMAAQTQLVRQLETIELCITKVTESLKADDKATTALLNRFLEG